MAETYTGDEGTEAANAGMDTLDGTEDRRDGWLAINKTRDYIAAKLAGLAGRIFPGILGETTPPTAAQVREAIGVVLTGTSANAGGKVPIYAAGGQLATGDPSSSGHAANKTYVDSAVNNINLSAYLPRSGGTVTGSLLLPNASAATSGYTVAYLNVDGRVSKGASSERYKKFISDIDPESLGDIWPQLVRYQMRQGDGSWKYGYIAETLDASDALRPFVVYLTETTYDEETDTYETHLVTDEAGNPMPDSIDFIALLMAQNAQLHQQVDLLAQRITALEVPDASN